MHKLTTAQKSAVQELLDGHRKYKSLKQPLGWHQIVLHWNWDDGVESIAWWCKQIKCDRGTALAVYWLASPEYYAQFDDRESAASSQCDMEVFDLVRDIETRIAEGFYKRAEIGFDPAGGYEDLSSAAVPQAMKIASPGEPFELVDLVTVWIRPLNEKERKSASRKLKQAWKFLGQAPKTASSDLVKLLETAATSHREGAVDSKEKSKAKILGHLWMEVAIQTLNWELLAWDWGTGASVMVFSPDRAWCIAGEHLFAGWSDRLEDSYICTLMNELANPAAFEERFEYEGCGILKSCAHLPFRPGAL